MIPRILYMTAQSNSDVPPFVFENWRRLNPGLEIKFFDDQDCKTFLLRNFGQTHVEVFNRLIVGPLKASFFRICLLYVHGGYYADIDLEPLVPLENMTPLLKEDDHCDWFSCIGAEEETFFLAWMGAEKGCWYFKEIIDIMINQGLPFLKRTNIIDQLQNRDWETYWAFAVDHIMFKVLNLQYAFQVHPGDNHLTYHDEGTKEMKMFFFKESFPEGDSKRWMESFVSDLKGTPIAKSRYKCYNPLTHSF